MGIDIVARDGIGLWSRDKDVGCDIMFDMACLLCTQQ
jgi:hypothetical protein